MRWVAVVVAVVAVEVVVVVVEVVVVAVEVVVLPLSDEEAEETEPRLLRGRTVDASLAAVVLLM